MHGEGHANPSPGTHKLHNMGPSLHLSELWLPPLEHATAIAPNSSDCGENPMHILFIHSIIEQIPIESLPCDRPVLGMGDKTPIVRSMSSWCGHSSSK